MRSQKMGPELRFWIKLSSGVFVALLIMVWQHVEAIRVEKELNGMRHEVDRLSYENGRMQMQIHQWESTSHLQEIARKDYNMGPLDPAHVIGMK
jgi:cell division protein FtsL